MPRQQKIKKSSLSKICQHSTVYFREGSLWFLSLWQQSFWIDTKMTTFWFQILFILDIWESAKWLFFSDLEPSARFSCPGMNFPDNEIIEGLNRITTRVLEPSSSFWQQFDNKCGIKSGPIRTDLVLSDRIRCFARTLSKRLEGVLFMLWWSFILKSGAVVIAKRHIVFLQSYAGVQ